MPNLRELLNQIKWTAELPAVEVFYIHRGAANNIKSILGDEIRSIGRLGLETSHATIPFHRIIKIVHKNKTIFDRMMLQQDDKQI